ncbi:hypothetical protein D1AOALGA4SA_13117 [Olavius algarvensis Delta 1 endosymbiont]|nr:hypothetical protein D1AOALGA4SA_13117 [Olavius algarvensis Delta 1 endosymbiont]
MVEPVSGVSPAAGKKTAGQIEKETGFMYECKLQITSTKIQINHCDLFEIWDFTPYLRCQHNS